MNFPYTPYQFCDSCTRPLRVPDGNVECVACGLVVHHHCIVWGDDPYVVGGCARVCESCWRECDED